MNQTVLKAGNGWRIGYLALLGIHLLAILSHQELIRFITKPLLMAWLMVYFISITSTGFPARKLTLSALFFSWLGDVFLMQSEADFFLAGLGSFLLAQLCYTWIFLQIRKRQYNRAMWLPVVFIAVGLYVLLLYWWLFPHLSANLKVPVVVYAIAIGSMLITSLHVSSPPYSREAIGLVTGASLFVLSDSLLAINQFIQPFPLAAVGIMLTYGLAQLFIVHSIFRIK